MNKKTTSLFLRSLIGNRIKMSKKIKLYKKNNFSVSRKYQEVLAYLQTLGINVLNLEGFFILHFLSFIFRNKKTGAINIDNLSDLFSYNQYDGLDLPLDSYFRFNREEFNLKFSHIQDLSPFMEEDLLSFKVMSENRLNFQDYSFSQIVNTFSVFGFYQYSPETETTFHLEPILLQLKEFKEYIFWICYNQNMKLELDWLSLCASDIDDSFNKKALLPQGITRSQLDGLTHMEDKIDRYQHRSLALGENYWGQKSKIKNKINYQESLNVDTELPFYRAGDLIFSFLGAMNRSSNFDLKPLLNKGSFLVDSFENSKKNVENLLLDKLKFLNKIQIHLLRKYNKAKKKLLIFEQKKLKKFKDTLFAQKELKRKKDKIKKDILFLKLLSLKVKDQNLLKQVNTLLIEKKWKINSLVAHFNLLLQTKSRIIYRTKKNVITTKKRLTSLKHVYLSNLRKCLLFEKTCLLDYYNIWPDDNVLKKYLYWRYKTKVYDRFYFLNNFDAIFTEGSELFDNQEFDSFELDTFYNSFFNTFIEKEKFIKKNPKTFLDWKSDFSMLDSSKSLINLYDNYTNILNDLPEGGYFYTNNRRSLLQKNMLLNSKNDGRFFNFYFFSNKLSSNNNLEYFKRSWFSEEIKNPNDDIISLNSTFIGKSKNVNWFTKTHQEKASINSIPWFLSEDLIRPTFKNRNWFWTWGFIDSVSRRYSNKYFKKMQTSSSIFFSKNLKFSDSKFLSLITMQLIPWSFIIDALYRYNLRGRVFGLRFDFIALKQYNFYINKNSLKLDHTLFVEKKICFLTINPLRSKKKLKLSFFFLFELVFNFLIFLGHFFFQKIKKK